MWKYSGFFTVDGKINKKDEDSPAAAAYRSVHYDVRVVFKLVESDEVFVRISGFENLSGLSSGTTLHPSSTAGETLKGLDTQHGWFTRLHIRIHKRNT